MASGQQKGNQDENSAAQKSMFQESGEESGSRPAGKRGRGPIHLKGTRSLERLRDRIDLAVKELHRLRKANLDLQKKLDEYRSQGVDSVDGTPIVFTESPEALRARVERFIEVIDHYVETHDDSSESIIPVNDLETD